MSNNEQIRMEADAIRAMAANASLCADILRDLIYAIRKGHEYDKAAAQRLLLVVTREVL